MQRTHPARAIHHPNGLDIAVLSTETLNRCRGTSLRGSYNLYDPRKGLGSGVPIGLDGFGERSLQCARVAAGADGPEGFDLDLPGALLRDTEYLRDLAQRADVLAIETMTHLEHSSLALGQRPDGLDECPFPLADLDARVVVVALLVGQEVAHLGAVLVARPADARVDARYRLAYLAQAPGLLWPDAKPLGELLLGGVAPELDAESVLGPPQTVQRVHHVSRETHGARVVGYGASHGLTYPPRRVRRETVAHLGVQLINSTNEARVTLLDEV